jgi:hypothetical protein
MRIQPNAVGASSIPEAQRWLRFDQSITKDFEGMR